MNDILVESIKSFLAEVNVVINGLLSGLIVTGLWPEKEVPLLASILEGLSGICFSLGVSLIVLKFLKKGFDVYILQTDGDAEADPLGLLVNFTRALAIAIGFPTLYKWMADATEETINAMLAVENMSLASMVTDAYMGIDSLLKASLNLIFMVMLIMLAYQMIKRGLEIYVLRIGVPIACVGLIENDRGAFKAYSQKFFQSMFAVIVQIVLLKVGLLLMATATGDLVADILQLLFAIAVLGLAFGMPKLLAEFTTNMSGGGGGLNTVYSGARMAQMAKGLFKR